MDRSKIRNISLIMTVFGCFFLGTMRISHYLSYLKTEKYFVEELSYFIRSTALLFVFTGLVIVIYRNKSRLLSLVWIVSYIFGGLIFWEKTDSLIFGLLPMFLSGLLFVTAFLEIIKVNGKPVKIVSRVIWFSVLALEILITVVNLFANRYPDSLASYAYNLAWVLMVLFTMAETMSFLEHISKHAVILGIVSVILMAVYAFWPGYSSLEEPFTKFLNRMPGVLLFLTLFFYTIWLYRAGSGKAHTRISVCIFTGVIGATCGVMFFAGYEKACSKDIGVIKDNVRTCYINQLNEKEYNWGEISGDVDMVPTIDLEYTIVDLNDGSMPVMFVRGGMTSEASGNTRIVFYDEAAQKPHQVWGNMNCIAVEGYIPCDEEHEYPVIFCAGGRQSVYHELIYEVRGGELCLIAQKEDVWPYDTDEIDPSVTSVDDIYLWNGEEVSMDQYVRNREVKLSGYREIEWYYL